MTLVGAKGFRFMITGELPPNLTDEAVARQFVASISVNAVIGPFVRTFSTDIMPLYQLEDAKKRQS